MKYRGGRFHPVHAGLLWRTWRALRNAARGAS
jgi:hypothetical protein